jgi:metal-responsive CopG/Arc/MetJ family transcriptional regulator
MYHIISVGMNSELLGQLDELRSLYPDASRKDIIANLIRDAHANATGWGKRVDNDNAAYDGALPVIR